MAGVVKILEVNIPSPSGVYNTGEVGREGKYTLTLFTFFDVCIKNQNKRTANKNAVTNNYGFGRAGPRFI